MSKLIFAVIAVVMMGAASADWTIGFHGFAGCELGLSIVCLIQVARAGV
jgi:hypothetical protein